MADCVPKQAPGGAPSRSRVHQQIHDLPTAEAVPFHYGDHNVTGQAPPLLNPETNVRLIRPVLKAPLQEGSAPNCTDTHMRCDTSPQLLKPFVKTLDPENG